jgi:hypothetical protein
MSPLDLAFATLAKSGKVRDDSEVDMQNPRKESPKCLQRFLLVIPVFINDYNHFIGQVDVADQLRSSYNSWRISFSYMLYVLFFWHFERSNEMLNTRGIHSQVGRRSAIQTHTIDAAR